MLEGTVKDETILYVLWRGQGSSREALRSRYPFHPTTTTLVTEPLPRVFGGSEREVVSDRGFRRVLLGTTGPGPTGLRLCPRFFRPVLPSLSLSLLFLSKRKKRSRSSQWRVSSEDQRGSTTSASSNTGDVFEDGRGGLCLGRSTRLPLTSLDGCVRLLSCLRVCPWRLGTHTSWVPDRPFSTISFCVEGTEVSRLWEVGVGACTGKVVLSGP